MNSLPEQFSIRTRPDAVHGTGLQVHQHSPGDILATPSLIVVYVDPFKLEVRLPLVGTSGVDTVLVTDDLPELGTNLVAALASLNVDDFSHVELSVFVDLQKQQELNFEPDTINICVRVCIYNLGII